MRQHLREILTSLPELAEQFPEFFERDLVPESDPAAATVAVAAAVSISGLWACAPSRGPPST